MKTLKELGVDMEQFDYVVDCDIDYILDSIDTWDRQEFLDQLQEMIEEIEVIYYSNAIEFLKENDQSLQESLSIAIEYGYTTLDNISSETLATLLKRSYMMEESEELADAIEERI